MKPSRPATSAPISERPTAALSATLAWCGRRRHRPRLRRRSSPRRLVPRICWSLYAMISVPLSRPGRTATASRRPTSRNSRPKAWSSTTRMCSRQCVDPAETRSSRKHIPAPLSTILLWTCASVCERGYPPRVQRSTHSSECASFAEGNAPTRRTSGRSKRISEPAVWTPQARQARSGSHSLRCSSCMAGIQWGWARWVTLQSGAPAPCASYSSVPRLLTVARATHPACRTGVSSRQPTFQ